MPMKIACQGFSQATQKAATDYWAGKWRRLERLLEPFPPEERHLQLTINEDGPFYEGRAVLMLPTGTLTGKGRSRSSDITEAMDDTADALASEIRRHKGLLRQEFLYRRVRRRREDLCGVLPALEETHSAGDRETFAALLRPALRGLSEHARRELILAQLEGVMQPGDLTVSNLLNELIVRAWQQFGHKPQYQGLELWLTGVLHGILDERGIEPAALTSSHGTIAQDDARLLANSGWSKTERFWPTQESLTLESVVSASFDVWARTSDEEQRRWILTQLRGFPRRQRRAFTLYVLEGWSEQDVAALQQTSPEQVLLDIEQVREAFSRNLSENQPDRC